MATLSLREKFASAAAFASGVYVLISSLSGTWRPSLNVWFSIQLVGNVSKCLVSGQLSFGGLWRFSALTSGISYFRTVRQVLRLEVDHQKAIIAAGGLSSVAEDPRRLWQLGLKHVQTAKQADGAAKKVASSGNMMVPTGPILKDLVLVGGGHSHAHVLLMLGMEPIPNVRVTLITRDVETPYSGMLPGHVAGHYTKEECHIDLVKLGRFANVRLIHAEVTGMEVNGQRVHIRSCLDNKERPSIRYDVLSIDVGCSPSTPGGLSGYDLFRSGDVGDNVCTVKPIDGFSRKLDRILNDLPSWNDRKEILVVGAGAGGIEIALALQHRLRSMLSSLGKDPAWVSIGVVSRSDVIMPNHSALVSEMMQQILDERGIQVHRGLEAQKIAEASGLNVMAGLRSELVCSVRNLKGNQSDDLVSIGFDECIWCTDGAPQGWLREQALETDAQGFLFVETTLQVRRKHGDVLQNVFAAGDCASIRGHPRPKAGVFAVMAGMPLSKNLRAVLEGRPLVEYLPQQEFLGIIGLGHGGAVASKGNVALRSEWLWELKDWIDRTWMWRYTGGLPRMKSSRDLTAGRSLDPEDLELLTKASMRCGGCGSKVGSTVLNEMIQRLKAEQPVVERPELLMGLDSPDDAAVVRLPGSDAVSVQTVDYFKSFVGDGYVFGRIAALHAMSDCWAMGAEAQVALAMCTIQLGSKEVMAEDLFQIMAGANHELTAAGCSLAGGHTTEGAESMFGLCVTGSCSTADRLMKKGNFKPGDAIFITKPIGSGCIFAGEMQQRTRGLHVSSALKWLLKSNEKPSRLAFKFGVRACTDVTGFGLAGHLTEMCKSSHGCSARIWLDKVPIMDGAEELIAAGITSSLQAENLKLRRAISNEVEVAKAFEAGHLPRYPLLFDPQTNGGLLLATDGEPSIVESFKKLFSGAGEDIWQIGMVEERPSSWEEGRFLTITARTLSE